MALHAAKGSGKITSGVNPLSGQTVKHSAAAWKAITAQYVKKYGPLDVTQPMGPFDVASSINAATRQKFDPQYKTLADQKSQSTAQDKNLSDWYGQYRSQLNDAANKAAAANSQAQQFSTNFANSSSALDASQRGQIAAQNQASATQRGAVVDPNQALVGQQADQSRRQNIGQQGALNAQQGANTQAYFGGRAVTTSGQELAGHQAEANRRQNISKAVQALQSSEGDYRTTLRQQIQASERQNQLARATFGLNQTKAQLDAAAKAAALAQSNTNNQRTTRTSAANNAATNRTSASNNANTNKTSSDNNKRTNANKGTGKSVTVNGVPHDKAYQTGFQNAWQYLIKNPGWRNNNPIAGWNRNTIIANVRKTTGASYSAAADAVDAVMKKYPQYTYPAPHKKL